MQAVIGIDTSCYTTSVAAASLQDERILQCRQLLCAGGAPGLRQSDALFQHVKNLPILMEELFALEKIEVRAVCASVRPRPIENSYMPVFLAGQGLGESLSAAMGVPYYEISHQEGHIAAGLYQSGLEEYADRPFIALHLSGGTTELILCDCGKQTLIGGTNDINLGQLIDRAGVMLGLTFPCGKELEKMAMACEIPPEGVVKSRVSGTHCFLSGAENQLQSLYEKGAQPNLVAAEAFSCAERTISRLIANAHEISGVSNFLLVGGVASSTLIRDGLEKRLAKRGRKIRLFFGKNEYCTDNAVGAALIGKDFFLKEKGEIRNGKTYIR